MTRTHLVLGLIFTLSLGAACGGDDSKNDAPPRLIEGGGAGDGAIDNVLNVHVIDEDTDEVIEGATVYIGEAGEELLEGTTDADGLIAFDDSSLEGPTTITVIADDYEAATWFGINAANVTIPVAATRGSSATFDSGTVSGTLDWTDLPEPPANHFYFVAMGYSQTDDLGDDANEIEQPTGDPAPNVCVGVPGAPLTACDWSVKTRTGTVAVAGSVIDLDTKGTEDDSDDTTSVLRFVYALGLSVDDGETVADVELDSIDGSDLIAYELDLPAAPSGLDRSAGLLSLETGDSGLLVLGFATDDTAAPTVTVPDLTGDFADAAYRMVAFAQKDDAVEDSDFEPMSALLHRGVTDLGGFEFGDYLPMAADLSEDGDTYSFEPVAGTPLHAIDLVRSNASSSVWNIAIFDERTEFVLPEIPNDPRPASGLDMTVDAFDGTIDLQEFAIDDFVDSFDRFSKARTSL